MMPGLSSGASDNSGFLGGGVTVNATWNPRIFTAAGLMLAVVFAAPAVVAAQAPATQGPVTFAKDVAPILQRNCQVCHRPGSTAPMSLLKYEEVRP